MVEPARLPEGGPPATGFLNLFPNHVDRHADGLGWHALVLVASLVVELALNEMIARRCNDARLNVELAGVDAEFCFGIEGQQDDGAGRISGCSKPHAYAVGDG